MLKFSAKLLKESVAFSAKFQGEFNLNYLNEIATSDFCNGDCALEGSDRIDLFHGFWRHFSWGGGGGGGGTRQNLQ